MESKPLQVCFGTVLIDALARLDLEYLYRLSVESGSGALVHTQWIVVRSGEDSIIF